MTTLTLLIWLLLLIDWPWPITTEGWNTPKYSLNRWPSFEVHHKAKINPKILNNYLIFTGTNVYWEKIDLYICQGTVWRENVWCSILIPIYLQSLTKKQASCRKRELWGASELFFHSFFFFFSVFRREVFQTYSRFPNMWFLSGLFFFKCSSSFFLVLPIFCVEDQIESGILFKDVFLRFVRCLPFYWIL